MVTKSFVVKLLEEFLGEYIINISKENLSVAVVRGKVKLENVQLDGDLIGSHVLSAVGLSGFAVLACTAEKFRANIPWSRLGKEPTTFELVGLHLICVPLLPSNASRVFGSGTKTDPKCTLRTRVKRSALARLERNFFHRRIPGEGPTPKQKRPLSSPHRHRPNTTRREKEQSSISHDSETKSHPSSYTSAWRQKLLEKLLRNVHMAVRNIHIRCEVSHGALNHGPHPTTSHHDYSSTAQAFAFAIQMDSLEYKSANQQWQTGTNLSFIDDPANESSSISSVSSSMVQPMSHTSHKLPPHSSPPRSLRPVSQRNLVSTRSAAISTSYQDGDGRNSYSCAGSAATASSSCTTTSTSAYSQNPIPSHHVLKEPLTRYKILQVQNLSMYWDVSPPVLLSESAILKEQTPSTAHKVLRKIRKALDLMKDRQDPGEESRNNLEIFSDIHHIPIEESSSSYKPHTYCFKHSNLEMQLINTIQDPTKSNQCHATLLPCHIHLEFNPIQMAQYNLLFHNMMTQQRLDTMLHQRPTKRPTQDPRAWWKYAISCVVACPQSRPWREVKKIISVRDDYIKLVLKKHTANNGLGDFDELILLQLEELLPIETLLVFHLIALRKVIDVRDRLGGGSNKSRISNVFRSSTSEHINPSYMHSETLVEDNDQVLIRDGLIDISISNDAKIKMTSHRHISELSSRASPHHSRVRSYANNEYPIVYPTDQSSVANDSIDFELNVEDVHDYMEKPRLSIDFNGSNINITIIVATQFADDPDLIARIQTSLCWCREEESSMSVDITRIDIFDGAKQGGIKVLTFDKIFDVSRNNNKGGDIRSNTFAISNHHTFQDAVQIPPDAVICQLRISSSTSGTSITLSASKAVFIWKTKCIKALVDTFFPGEGNASGSVLRTQLRNAATPLAHKAQIALLSPKSISLRLDIEAPQMWFPVSHDISDGALFLDMGQVEASLTKPQFISNAKCLIDVQGISVSFRKETKPFFDRHSKHQVNDISVVLPFDLQLSMDSRSICDIDQIIPSQHLRSSRTIGIVLTKIKVNLVDLEILAMALGKILAAELLLVQERGEDNFKIMDSNIHMNYSELYELSLRIDEISLFLQGKSLSKTIYKIRIENFALFSHRVEDCRSSAVSVKCISIENRNESQKSSDFIDISIDVSHDVWVTLLSCSDDELLMADDESSVFSGLENNPAIVIKIMRDYSNHFDDLDTLISRLFLCLTPDNLNDFAVTIGRISKAMKIVTKEMERRAHTINRMRSFERSGSNDVKPTDSVDSIFVIKLSLGEGTFSFGTDRVIDDHRKNSVGRITSKLLFMFQSTLDSDMSGKKTLHLSMDECSGTLCDDFAKDAACEIVPLWNPFGMEFRKSSSIVSFIDQSHEVSIDVESIRCRISVDDLLMCHDIMKKFQFSSTLISEIYKPKQLSVFKVNPVATIIYIHFQPWNVELYYEKEKSSVPLLLMEFKLQGQLDGCTLALSGEFQSDATLRHFSRKCKEWVDVVEHHVMNTVVNFQPSDLTLSISLEEKQNINVTNEMLEEFRFLIASSISKDEKACSIHSKSLSPESSDYIMLHNSSGLPLYFEFDEIDSSTNYCLTVNHNSRKMIQKEHFESPHLLISIDPHSEPAFYERPSISVDLRNCFIDCETTHHTFLSINHNKLHLEPVVEYCMQNQCLSAGVESVNDIAEGSDLLSSSSWSPGDKNPSHKYWTSPDLKGSYPRWSDMTSKFQLEMESIVLPDKNWMWSSDWIIDIHGSFGTEIDSDGYEYATDFSEFGSSRRFYTPGDKCRRRRLIRVRSPKYDKLHSIYEPISFVLRYESYDGIPMLRVESTMTIKNETSEQLILYGYRDDWGIDREIGILPAKEVLRVPATMASATHICLAVKHRNNRDNGYCMSKRILVVPYNLGDDPSIIRTEIFLGLKPRLDVSATSLHFLLEIKNEKSLKMINVLPVMKILNYLPCDVDYRLLEAGRQRGDANFSRNKMSEDWMTTEEKRVSIGAIQDIISVDPSLNPSISWKIPGYKWSFWQRIVNRVHSNNTWNAKEADELLQYRDEQNAEDGSYKSLIQFESNSDSNDTVTIIMSVEFGHTPSVIIYAQYWIINSSSFGLKYSDDKKKIIRQSHRVDQHERENNFERNGYQWAIGMDGLSIYFSRERKICVTAELMRSFNRYGITKQKIRSQWSGSLDISHTLSKSTFTLKNSLTQDFYDISYNVLDVPMTGSRTKIVHFFNRFLITNATSNTVFISQDNISSSYVAIEPRDSRPMHWVDMSLPRCIRLSINRKKWTKGTISLEKIGISSIVLRDSTSGLTTTYIIEVRLAPLDQNHVISVIVMNANESEPLHMIRNLSSSTVLCRQKVLENKSHPEENYSFDLLASMLPNCGNYSSTFEENRNILTEWVLNPGESSVFGFDDPQRSSLLEWSTFDLTWKKYSTIDVSHIGSSNFLNQVKCEVKVEKSAVIIEFSPAQDIMKKISSKALYSSALEARTMSVTVRFVLPEVSLSIIDCNDVLQRLREIAVVSFETITIRLAYLPECIEAELKIMNAQVDNHFQNATHPVMICFASTSNEPDIHLSLVRKRNLNHVRYVALRLLELHISIDAKSIEAIINFISSSCIATPTQQNDVSLIRYITKLTKDLQPESSATTHLSDHFSSVIRLYLEELHLHPIRVSFTFTQNIDSSNRFKDHPLLQYMDMCPSITRAPIIFTSFVVSQVFESHEMIRGILLSHYSSQWKQHIFSLIGSMDILTTPIDILTNIGTGVRDFFYEPINGLVHGPTEFVSGVQSGSISLAKGVLGSIVKGASGLTWVVNSNLAQLTDAGFVEERNAHEENVTMSKSQSRTVSETLQHAGSSMALGFRSASLGLIEEPKKTYLEQGSAGLMKGIGMALIGAVIKPMIGVGDAGRIVLDHVSDLTNESNFTAMKKTKRNRRVLGLKSYGNDKFIPYNAESSKAQDRVMKKKNRIDVYIGHVTTENQIFIASSMYLWIVDKKTDDEDLLSWTDISHCTTDDERNIFVIIFTPSGLTGKTLEFNTSEVCRVAYKLISMQAYKFINSKVWPFGYDVRDFISRDPMINLLGLKTAQKRYVFGSCNCLRMSTEDLTHFDEIDIVENFSETLKELRSSAESYFSSIDKSAWALVDTWKRKFEGMASRRCLVFGIMNGSIRKIQLKSSIVMEGGSPCFRLPSYDFDEHLSIINPGGFILFFCWGNYPNLVDAGNIRLWIDTNAFMCTVSFTKPPSSSLFIEQKHGYTCVCMEKSITDWWSKYFIIVI